MKRKREKREKEEGRKKAGERKEGERKKRKRGKKGGTREKRGKEEGTGRRRVTCTMNNTKAVRTWYDKEEGKRVNRVKTAGSRGYKNAKRGTGYAGQEVVGEVAREYRGKKKGGRNVVRRGMGRGRGVVLTERGKYEGRGRKVRTVSDGTKDAHNGCIRKKKRRV